MSDRSYRTSSKWIGDNMKSAYVFNCSECTNSDYIMAGKITGRLAPEMIEKNMSRRGWYLGKRESGDLCPACQHDRRKKLHTSSARMPAVNGIRADLTPLHEVFKDIGVKHLVPTKLAPAAPVPVIPAKMPVAPKEDPVMNEHVTPPTPEREGPREMTRADRRLVFSAINDVYVDENEGYPAGVDDASIAKQLGCPRAWVASVREADFGPAEGNPKLRALMERYDALEKRLGDFRAGLVSLNSEMDGVRADMKALRR